MQITLGRPVIDQRAILEQVIRVARPKIQQFATDLAENGERLATAAANDLYDTNRPANRRRDPGSNRLGSGSMFQGAVTPTERGALVVFQVLGGGVKFNSLNYGSVAHEIRPRNKKALAWPGIGPSSPSSFRKGQSILTMAKKVNHPGTTGSGFWEKAIAEARRTTRVR